MPISLANIIDREQGATSQEHKTQNDTEFSKMDNATKQMRTEKTGSKETHGGAVKKKLAANTNLGLNIHVRR